MTEINLRHLRVTARYSFNTLLGFFVFLLRFQRESAIEGRALLRRNSNLWQSVLSGSYQAPFHDPTEITYEASPELAGRLDGGAL